MTTASSALDPRYPVGKFEAPALITAEDRARWIEEIAELPHRLAAAITHLNEAQLATPYREGGWTVRQVVHHLADSHLNSFLRFKFALTEDSPTIRGYPEALWAELDDARTAPVESSMAVLAGLHSRWATLLHSMTEEQFQRTFRHSERGLVRLDNTLALYAWHCRHHLAHITTLRSRMNW